MQAVLKANSVATPGDLRSATKLSVAISVDSSVESGLLREHIEELVRRAGARIAADGEACDVLLLGVGPSTPSHLLREVAQSAITCAIWVSGEPSRNQVLRILRVGMAGILSLDVSPEQLSSAFKAMRLNLQVVDAQFARAGVVSSFQSALGGSEELTDREQQVLGMMADGLANKEISSRLGISSHTVKFHISSILGKLGASSRTEAVSIGVRSGRVVI
jgi:DNA-binding NarL/FixJ family response regulator